MNYLDLTLPTPEENLALDEALLDWAENTGEAEMLRVWEPLQPFAVLGYSNRAEHQLHLSRCLEEHLPVLRRCSGGGTVLQGPGCLNYTLILKTQAAPGLETVAGTNQVIMQRHQALIQKLIPSGKVEIHGHTDLALNLKKFSGNAQRRKRAFLLFHGTFLLHFDLALIERYLRFPPQSPPYRGDRSHLDFLTNLPLPSNALRSALRRHWNAFPVFSEIPTGLLRQRILEKYGRRSWNFKF